MSKVRMPFGEDPHRWFLLAVSMKEEKVLKDTNAILDGSTHPNNLIISQNKHMEDRVS